MADDVKRYERGPYAKGRRRREEIIAATLDVFSRVGYRGASLRAIAHQIHISPALLQHYFPTREDLLAAVVNAWGEASITSGEGVPYFDATILNVRRNMQVPGLVHLYTAFAVEAVDPGHPARPFFAQRYDTMTRKMIDEIRASQHRGEVAAHVEPEHLARLIIAALEGLQMRWLHSPDFDMSADYRMLLEQFGISSIGVFDELDPANSRPATQ